jgi:hypothetical protein
MKAAKLILLSGMACTLGCAENDLSLSIIEMQAIVEPSCMATATAGGSTSIGRNRGLLDLSLVGMSGYIGAPVVRNNLISLISGGVERNSIQLTGADVKLMVPASAAGLIAASDLSFFYASAGGRLDPAGTAPMFVEVLPAKQAKELAPAVPANGLLTVIAEIKPVGMHESDQVVGGPLDYPIDICTHCLVTNRMCPFPKGSMPSAGGCFPQQDDVTQCCTDTTGKTFCGAAAPVATM